jgi:hypothetical protein
MYRDKKNKPNRSLLAEATGRQGHMKQTSLQHVACQRRGIRSCGPFADSLWHLFGLFAQTARGEELCKPSTDVSYAP